MPRGRADLTQGSVLHIVGFASRGHPAKNKYLLVLGACTETEVLAFLISSRLHYLQMDPHKREVVRIPHNATSFLLTESLIQCFELERLAVGSLEEGFEQGRVTHAGRLPVKYLHRVRDAVATSFLLPQVDIDLVLKLLPAPSSSG